MYVFGGYDGTFKNDLHTFNFVTNTWYPVNYQGFTPPNLFKSSAVSSNDFLYIFGGSNGSYSINDIYAFCYSTERWSQIKAKASPIPHPRDSHIMIAHQNSLFIFGGIINSTSNDFLEFRLNDSKWIKLNIKSIEPKPRHGHSSALIGNSLYVFGGCDGTSKMDDLIYFQFEDHEIGIPSGTLSLDLLEFVNNKVA